MKEVVTSSARLVVCQRRSRCPQRVSSAVGGSTTGWHGTRCRADIARRSLRICAQDQTQEAVATQSMDQVPPGCARYTVRLNKPLGMVLEERPTGDGTKKIIVADLVKDGAAARSGEITVGDELIATSGRAYTAESEYQGNTVRSGEVYVRVSCRSESFDTIMAAITSHPATLPVTLEFQRCD